MIQKNRLCWWWQSALLVHKRWSSLRLLGDLATGWISGLAPLPWETHNGLTGWKDSCFMHYSNLSNRTQYILNKYLTGLLQKIHFSITNQFYILFGFLSMPLSLRTFDKWLFVCISELHANDIDFIFYCTFFQVSSFIPYILLPIPLLF